MAAGSFSNEKKWMSSFYEPHQYKIRTTEGGVAWSNIASNFLLTQAQFQLKTVPWVK